jgi:hypothetical protein
LNFDEVNNPAGDIPPGNEQPEEEQEQEQEQEQARKNVNRPASGKSEASN